MKRIVGWLIDWPRRVALHLAWLAPLFARITVGWVFLWSGWGKLNNLPQVTQNFVDWGIPLPHLLTPFTSGVEFFGGLFLLAGVAHPHLGGCARDHHDRCHQGGQVGRRRFPGDAPRIR